MPERDRGEARPGAEYVYGALVDAEVDLLVGLPGTQTLPLDRIVAERDAIEYLMARHETAIPHVAWGYHEAGGGIAATLTVPGPGDTNAMHGLKNALEDCVPLIHVAADVDPDDRGKGPIHEIEPDTYDNVVKENVVVEDALGLQGAVERGIETALATPKGPVRLGIPNTVLSGMVRAPAAEVDPERVEYDAGPALAAAADALAASERPVIYAGGGARRSSEGPRVAGALADVLSAPVVTSYKGKGVFPEDDPRWLGVTGKHLPASAVDVLERADVVLALGTDFDGVTTGGWSLPMGGTLIHVNADPGEIGAAYDADIAVVGDVTAAGDTLLERLDGRDPGGWDGAAQGEAAREAYVEHLEGEGLLSPGQPANTPAVLRAVREALPREAVVTTDVGGHRLWAFQTFPAYAREGYVTAGSWAGMGVGLPAALGAKAANPDVPVLTITGDGGLMMCIHELHTAAEEGLDVIAVVFSDADYGIISKQPGIEAYGDGRRFAWEPPDFAAIAEGFGCRGTSVETPEGAADAVERALDRDRGPEVIDVRIARHEQSPFEAADFES